MNTNNNNNCNVTNNLHLNSDQPKKYNTCNNNSKSPNKITETNPYKGNQLVDSAKAHSGNKDSFLRKIITFKNPFN